MSDQNNEHRPEVDSGVDQLLERFLDGQMSPVEAEQFLGEPSVADRIETERNLDSEIDSSLERMFGRTADEDERLIQMATSPITNDLEESNELSVADDSASNSAVASNLLNRRWLQLVVAAGLLFVILLSWNAWPVGRSAVEFEPRSLVELYQETQVAGFRPYYNCEDQQRFADTFEKRQGQRLALAEMPADLRMLGLSYLGGISRDTTAMLGEVAGEQVIVFVDKAINRDKLEAIAGSNKPNLNVFTVEKHGLIFAEVTPHTKPMLIDFFKFDDVQP